MHRGNKTIMPSEWGRLCSWQEDMFALRYNLIIAVDRYLTLIIIIIVKLLPISLTRSSSEVQQTKSVGQSHTGTGKGCHWSMEPLKMYTGKAISKKYIFIFYERCL